MCANIVYVMFSFRNLFLVWCVLCGHLVMQTERKIATNDKNMYTLHVTSDGVREIETERQNGQWEGGD